MNLAFGLALNFIVFLLIGVGPCFLLLTNLTPTLAFGLAPAIGFVFVTITGVYLTLLNVPVSCWFLPLTVLGISLSALAAVLALRLRRVTSDKSPLSLPLAILGIFLLAAIILTAPILGGERYRVLRGNGVDSFNYVALAGYLNHEPYAIPTSAEEANIEARHPSYKRARGFLKSRWATGMMLAFASNVAGVPVLRFDYAFSLLMLVLAFGPAYCICVGSNVPPWLAVATALAVCAGFWAQFVTDIRALAQESAVPIVLGMVTLLSRWHDSPSPRPWRDLVVVGIFWACLANTYPEMLLTCLLGWSVFCVIRMARRQLQLRILLQYGFCVAAFLIATLPTLGSVRRFWADSIAYAALGANNWQVAYFSWLYARPLAGIWGLVMPQGESFDLYRSGMRLLGVALTIVAAATMLRSLFAKTVSSALLFSVTIIFSALMQWAYLAAHNQLWSGAKGLSFGYPYLILLLPLAYCSSNEGDRSRVFLWLRRGGAALAGIFVAVQCLMAIMPTWMLNNGQSYELYIAHHGEYGTHNWDFGDLEYTVSKTPGLTIWAGVESEAVWEYLSFALGWKARIVNIGSTAAVRSSGIQPDSRTPSPDYLILETQGLGPFRLAESALRHWTSEFSIFSLRTRDGAILGIENPNGFDAGSSNVSSFWAGGGPTRVLLYSACSGIIHLRAQFRMGPSLESRTRTILTQAEANELPQTLTISESTGELQFRVPSGIHAVSFTILDKPRIILATDPRPLLLRVESLRVGF